MSVDAEARAVVDQLTEEQRAAIYRAIIDLQPSNLPAVRQPSTPAVVQPHPPTAWYADPSGKYAQRWWNSAGWTAHVRVRGRIFGNLVETIDPSFKIIHHPGRRPGTTRCGLANATPVDGPVNCTDCTR